MQSAGHHAGDDHDLINSNLLLKEEPKNTSELTISVFNQASVRNNKEIEFDAHSFKSS